MFEPRVSVERQRLVEHTDAGRHERRNGLAVTPGAVAMVGDQQARRQGLVQVRLAACSVRIPASLPLRPLSMSFHLSGSGKVTGSDGVGLVLAAVRRSTTAGLAKVCSRACIAVTRVPARAWPAW